MPLKVLIIEDTQERQEALRALYRRQAWIMVSTGEHALTLLNAYQFDIITLDYNLGGQLTGADVALGIRNSINQKTQIVIHSLNPLGAAAISRIIPEAVIFPLSKMIRSNRFFRALRKEIEESELAFRWSEAASLRPCDSP